MNVENNKKRALLSWLFAVVLVGLCAALGAIQYRWIGEVSRAEHERLRGNLQAGLTLISEDFDAAIGDVCSALSPEFPSPDEAERERQFGIQYAQWRSSSRYDGLVQRLAMAIRHEDSVVLRIFNPEKGVFDPADWPAGWNALRDRLTARVQGDPSIRRGSFRAPAADEPALIDLPQFGRRERGVDHGPPGPGELGWTILDLDLNYIRADLLPELVQRRLGAGEKLDYHVDVVAKDYPSTVIYSSDANLHSGHSDASIGLFDAPFDFGGRPRGPAAGPPGRRPVRAASSNRGRWVLSVRHRTGSLEALVEQNRRRSLAVTAAILLLMLAAIGALVQFSRRAQRLAELQMEFVASVSHELRTPLSVIRTAAHNLGVRVISNANQVQRYGSLIEEQSEKLTAIVDRVLLFSNAKAGRAIRSREAVGVEFLVEEALGACAKIVEQSLCVVETHIEPDLPPVFGDPTALKHALLNLIGNAAKYASEGRWIGIYATMSVAGKATMIEIRVADRGPGIPPGDRVHIFDPFYRGKMAVDDQIHGTGLGLSLVDRIVKAHGGAVTVSSEPGKGTEFVMRIPAAPEEHIDEFADSASRR